MRHLIILLLLLYQTCSYSQDTISREKRLQNYYKTLVVYESTLKDLRSKGINPFVPDYSEDGGGYSFRVFTTLRASLQAQANLLGIKEAIPNGWYKSTVYYSHSRTTTRSKYTLRVEVEYGKVVSIDFPDAGRIHDGENGYGYIYKGGDLEGKTTVVEVHYPSGGIATYEVVLD